MSANDIAKDMRLDISQVDKVYPILKALASKERMQILGLLSRGYRSIGELSRNLGMPFSSTAFHVRMLEDAGLVVSETRPGVHGALKLVSRNVNSFYLSLSVASDTYGEQFIDQELPIGAYSRVEGVKRTCGLASQHSIIGEDDNPHSFYSPERLNAQILWMREGSVEYDFSLLNLDSITIQRLELSFEACSEAPMYRDPWLSDISVWINGVSLGVWTCPCDCGGRKGLLNPVWWTDTRTQYGFLKNWSVDHKGAYLDGVVLSSVTLDDLLIEQHGRFSVRIGVDRNAKNKGGMNLFGEAFGDYPQSLKLRVYYNFK